MHFLFPLSGRESAMCKLPKVGANSQGSRHIQWAANINKKAVRAREARLNRSFQNLSIYLTPQELEWPGWLDALGRVFRTLVLHGSADQLRRWKNTAEADSLIRRLVQQGVEIEFAVHLCSELVPRSLFPDQPELFRMDEHGRRTADANLCPSNDGAFPILAENLREITGILTPTTGRHHIWPDDDKPWCHCAKCRDLSWPDQNLLFTNMLARALRLTDSRATVSYLAYKPAVEVPQQVRPERNVFLEYAPITRSYRYPLSDEHSAKNRVLRKQAEALLAYFGSGDSQLLEYWLDVSMFSGWKKPVRKIPVSGKVVAADLAFYRSVGFRNIGQFGVWFDGAYVREFGDGPLCRFRAAAGFCEGPGHQDFAEN